jgi:TRAP transporter TAXI family solute receptor
LLPVPQSPTRSPPTCPPSTWPPLGPDRRALLRGLAGLAALPLLGAGASTRAENIRFFQIATGTTGGTYFLIGGLIANAVSSPPGAPDCAHGGSCGVPGLIAVAQATSGAVENVTALRDGRLDSAMVQANIAVNAYVGDDPFAKAGPFRELRAIANLYTEAVHLVVRADSRIASVADLKGRRVSLGEQGSGTLVTARRLLGVYGLSEKAVKPAYLGPGASTDLLAGGQLDAFFIIGGYPIPAVADLATRLPIALVPLNDERVRRMMERLHHFSPTVIAETAYAGVPTVQSIGVGAEWLVHARQDPDLIYGLTRALWNENTLRLLQENHPVGGGIRPGQALQGLAVPLHPGAARYYQEAGITVPATAGSSGRAAADRPGGPVQARQ